jgi:hypothetical protein
MKATPKEYEDAILLAGRWIDPPGAPVTAFARAVRELLIANPKMSTADALCSMSAQKPDLFASHVETFDALAHKRRGTSIPRRDDREALAASRGW